MGSEGAGPHSPARLASTEELVCAEFLDELDIAHGRARGELAVGDLDRVFPTAVYGRRLSADFDEDHLRAAVNYLRSLAVTAHVDVGTRQVRITSTPGQREVARHMASSAPDRWGSSWHGRQARRGYAGAVACVAESMVASLPAVAGHDRCAATAAALRSAVEQACAVTVVESLCAMLVRYRLTAAHVASPAPRTLRWNEQLAAAVARIDRAVAVLLEQPATVSGSAAARLTAGLLDVAGRVGSLPADPCGGGLPGVERHLRRQAAAVTWLAAGE